MGNQSVVQIDTVINFIEEHLDQKLDLETIATAVHYSKFHLHRVFSDIVGITIHDYVVRRQLTEAAKLLVFSQKPILEIALICGYESQQAFTSAFKAMYKIPPAEYREREAFYPLQLKFSLHKAVTNIEYTKANIHYAEMTDIPAWMELVYLVINGYPHFDEKEYREKLVEYIQNRQALIFKEEEMIVGALAFSYETGSIDFVGIHPQYRNRGIQRLFLDALMEDYLPGREISTTTYREHDKADAGHRAELKRLGFAERELLIEFGYPTQRFVISQEIQEKKQNG